MKGGTGSRRWRRKEKKERNPCLRVEVVREIRPGGGCESESGGRMREEWKGGKDLGDVGSREAGKKQSVYGIEARGWDRLEKSSGKRQERRGEGRLMRESLLAGPGNVCFSARCKSGTDLRDVSCQWWMGCSDKTGAGSRQESDLFMYLFALSLHSKGLLEGHGERNPT
jgi:hypothetical protein